MNETILVVDDERAVRSLIAEYLRRCGYRVIEADGASEALRRVEAHPQPIDLALVDLTLPDGDGQALLVTLEKGHPELRAILMSGHSELAGSGALPAKRVFLAKPFELAELVRKVRAALEGHGQ